MSDAKHIRFRKVKELDDSWMRYDLIQEEDAEKVTWREIWDNIEYLFGTLYIHLDGGIDISAKFDRKEDKIDEFPSDLWDRPIEAMRLFRHDWMGYSDIIEIYLDKEAIPDEVEDL